MKHPSNLLRVKVELPNAPQELRAIADRIEAQWPKQAVKR